MKKLFFTIVIAFAAATVFAQAPQGFNYQGVARDSADNILTAQSIGIKISILETSAGGPVVYSEAHNTTSDDFGVFDLVIGTGTVLSGTFSTINWGGDSHFVKIEMDATGGTNYQLMGTTQLLSVPYSLYAENAGNVSYADTSATNELQAISLSNDTVYLTNGGYVVLPAGTANLDNDSTNELQILSFSNDTLYLTNGGTVFLPFNYADTSASNELQVLSISNDTLYLTNGGFAILPSGSNQTLSFSGDTLYLTNGGYVYLGTSLPCNPPATSGAISGNNPICENAAGEVYTATAVQYATVYTWSVPSGSTILSGQGGLSITVNWGTTSGNISVIASNSCDSAAASNLPVSISLNPTTANAGSDSINLPDTITTLNANTPIVGTGLWTIVGGTGGAITAPSNPTSTFTGLTGQSYILRWTISNFPCIPSYDEANITFFTNCGDPITDARDGQTYNTVLIGTQCWMAENLNIGSYINSTFGGEYSDGNQNDNGIIEKYCYDNSSGSCSTFGGLYQWYEMMQYTTIQSTQGVCPVGWHIPSTTEWTTMESYVGANMGGAGNVGDKLKIVADCFGGVDCGISNFAGLLAGSRSTTGAFNLVGTYGYFWSSTESGSNAFYRALRSVNAVVINNAASRLNGNGVRCVKD